MNWQVSQTLALVGTHADRGEGRDWTGHEKEAKY